MSSSTPAVRILVVDDDADLRDLLERALAREGFEARSVARAEDVDRVIHTFPPDLAILDVHLGPGADGYALARRLRLSGDIPFLFLTEASSMEARLTGFETGADDYVAKPFELAELLARVRALLRRAGKAAAGVWEIGPLKIDESGRRVFLEGEGCDLTRIEFDLLAALARQPGRVLTKTQLLSMVWGFDGYDPNLVEVHVSSLRRKLGSGAGLIQTVRGVGYVLRG